VGSTDSESFRLRKIPSLTVHSLTQKTWSILHTPDDKVSALNLDDYYQTYRLLVGYLVYLDE
jgi:Iap family predicted aminopeptidase